MPISRSFHYRALAAFTALLLLLSGCDSNEEGPEVGIEDVAVGSGTTAQRGMNVTVHYTGWLTDQTVFDTSEDGDPITFRLDFGRVIEGWVIGVSGMKEGGIRRLEIPPELAYGEQGIPCGPQGRPCDYEGQGYIIPPNATLVFRVELIKAEVPTASFRQ